MKTERNTLNAEVRKKETILYLAKVAKNTTECWRSAIMNDFPPSRLGFRWRSELGVCERNIFEALNGSHVWFTIIFCDDVDSLSMNYFALLDFGLYGFDVFGFSSLSAYKSFLEMMSRRIAEKRVHTERDLNCLRSMKGVFLFGRDGR